MSNTCNDLKVIPQYVGSCWFNSFLMTILYSENARKIMIKASKTWDKNNKLLNIFKYILKKNYNDPSIANYYTKMQPQLIISEFLKKHDVKLEQILKTKIKQNITNFGWNNLYFAKFLKYIYPNSVDIYYDYKTNSKIINFDKNIEMYIQNGKTKTKYDYVKPDINKETKEISKIIKDIPDFIILYHSQFVSKTNVAFQGINYLKNKKELDVYNLDYHNIKEDGIKDYKDIMTLNGVKYKLDSCLIGNFDENANGHSIVGITCNGNRYVYNGWMMNTIDPAIKDVVKNGNKFPCSLMKYHWDLNKDEEFCLNQKQCKLDFVIDKKDLCFSFGKGERILVYVRILDEEIKTSDLKSVRSSKAKISNIKEMIKDIYEINNLTKDELIKHIINMYRLNNDQVLYLGKKSMEELKKMVYDKLIEKYNLSKSLTPNNYKSRKLVHNKYKPVKDLIEKNPDKENKLKQQIILSMYVLENYSMIDKMLIFHGIGTGKTCTGINIYEKIVNKYENMKALVILPARLKTNFIDELISKNCVMDKYISVNDRNKYKDDKTSKKDKDNIRKKFMSKINENYEILSYESLRNKLIKSNDVIKTIEEITKNRIVIIDEIHNLITTRIKTNIIDDIIKNKKISKNTKMINGVIMRLMTRLAHNSSKFFLLTATPVFDNYGQFIELVLNLCPEIKEAELNRNIDDLKFLVEKLRGKVSYYKLSDISAYPASKIDNIEIPLSKTQDDIISGLISDSNENSNMFCITERQISISTFSLKDEDKVFSNLKEYAPKLKKLFELLELDGKHVVYSNFINYCLELIASYLKKNGWNNYIEDGIKKNKTFVLWDASLNDDNKQDVKNVLNSISNMDGSKIKVVLGSPSIKEGISFKHIQHLHQIDPVWNSSAKTQVEGRCIRYKSHDEIPLNHPKLKREVVIHNYISVAKKGGNVLQTCDSKIYYEIIKKKKKLITIIENILMKVSIDYYLWKDGKIPEGSSSRISLSKEKEEIEGIIDKKKVKERKVNKGNNCPKIRRPKGNECLNKDYPFMRKNAKGFKCCYKKAK